MGEFHKSRRGLGIANAGLLLLMLAAWAIRAGSAEPPKAPRPLASIAEILQLGGTTAPAGMAVRITTQVTYVDADWGVLFVQDRTGAIFVKVGKEAGALRPGDVVDLRALTAPGAIGPILTNPHFKLIRKELLPSPQFAPLSSLNGGNHDSRYVVSEGVLRPGPGIWNHTSLLLVDGPTKVPIMIPGGVNSSILTLVGAVVRVRAINSARFDDHNRRLGAQLLVSAAAEIEPEDPLWNPDSRLATRKISFVAVPSRNQRFLPAVHLKGTMVWKSSRDAFVLDDSGGILVHSVSNISDESGSVVHVVGFPDREDGVVVLRDAVVRRNPKLPSAWPLPAVRKTASSVVRSGHDGQRVRIVGRLISQQHRNNEQLLTIEDSGTRFVVRVAAPENAGQMITILPQAVVQCDGLVRVVAGPGSKSKSFELLVDSVSDVVVQSRRELSLRLLLGLGMPCCAGAVLLWIIQLNRTVRSKTVQIRRQMEELQQARDEARLDAERDMLTGLPNRRRFFQILEERTQVAALTAKSLALLYIDLDSFKMTNDTLGHFFGDLLIKEVADRFSSSIGPDDTFCRIGGDEFAVLLASADDAAAIRKSAGLLIEALRFAIQIQGQELTIGASIGISTFPNPAADATLLLIQSDAAMYEAKRSGGNGIAFYTEAMGSEINDKNRILTELKKAIERGEIYLEYQPQFDARTMKILRFEALARWTNQTLGPVPPSKFIPIAEECGFILELGAHILEKACRDAVEWNRASGQSIPVAVNVSTIQLRSERFPKMVLRTLRRVGLHPGLLELEMTESVMADDLGELAGMLADLRSAGITLSLDDFGTGYSCLAYLRQLPFDRLKVDPSFLKQADLDSETAVLITAVARVAHALDMKVVVEGIETEREMDFVTRLGADELQGYLLGRPTRNPIDVLQLPASAKDSDVRLEPDEVIDI